MAALARDQGSGIGNQGNAPRIRNFRDLLVWQAAIDLAVETYRIAANLPDSERYGLRAQMQRASVSVAANIAEGNGRAATGAYINHLGIAHGSLMELETYLVLVVRLRFLGSEDTASSASLARETGKMLRRLILRLKERVGRTAQEPGSRGEGGRRIPDS